MDNFLIERIFSYLYTLKPYIAMHRNALKLISIIYMLMCAFFASAQSPHLFTLDDGLSSTLFKSLYLDSKGILWIGTEDGLNSFDGNKFIIHKNIPGDSTSIQSNFISTILEDKYGRLLIGTYMGLQAYDQATGKFNLATENGKMFHDGINKIIQRKNGEVWCFGNRIMKLEDDPNSLKLTPVYPELGMTNKAIEDNDGNLWISNDNNLTRLSPDGEKKSYFGKEGDSRIQALTLDNKGTLYLGTNRSGLWRYEPGKDEFIHLYKDSEPLNILDFLVLDNGDIVIATDGKGIKLYDASDNTFSTYTFSNSNLDFRRLKTHHVVKDKCDNMWITIFQKGLLVVPPESNSFKYIGEKSFVNNVIGSSCITSIADDSKGNLWVGTDNDGIYLLDPYLRQKKHYYGDNIPPVIMNLFIDSKDNIWVGSYTNGAGVIDGSTGVYTSVPLKSDISNGLGSENVFGFAEDKNDNIYIATMGNGLFRYNYADRKAKHMSDIEELVGKGCNWIASLHYSPERNAIFAGTYSGLYKISLNKFDVELVVPDIIVHNIHESSDDGSLWLGTSQGLLKFDPEKKSSVTFTTENGLPSNTIYGIEDVNGDLWLSSNSGLSYYPKKDNKFINFFVNDGLQGNEFYKGAVLKSREGILFFGGTNGITYFAPSEIESPGRTWNIRINDLFLHGNPVKNGTKSGSRNIIDTDIHEAESFHFAHNDNSFSIEFSTQELYRPQSVVFCYRLDNDDWTVLPFGTNTVNFSELSPGKHKLTVKAIDNGVESKEREFTIDIAHPWWDTWLAHLIFTVFIIGCILFLVWKLHRNAEDKKRNMEEKHQKELNEAKLQFFINISHEIRTPLTLVMSPLRKLLETDTDEDRRREYNIINRNANRILRLINELMDIRKIDRNQMHLAMKEVMLVPFINDLRDTFLPTANQKNISLQFHADGKEHIKAWVDPSNFDKILMNLLSNALKYTPEGGKIDINISEGTNPEVEGPLHDYIEITVADTGIGIAPSEREKIFQRFYQVRNSHTGGTGVGLHLTHSLVRLHHGELSVHDNTEAGKGSVFRIIIPQGDDHLSQDEKYEATEEENVQQPIVSEADTLTALINENYADDVQRSRGETILIVEDDGEIRTYLQNELSSKYKTIACTNGKEALELLAQNGNSIDVIVSDVMMPEIDGIELTRRVKQNLNLNHIPVILLTAKTRDEDMIKGLDMGADAYMTKPFNIKILRSKIDNLVRNNRRLKNIYNGTQSPKEHMKEIDASSGDDKLIARVMKVINKNLSNPDITVEMLAQEVGLSRVHLHRKLKELTNQSPRDFIRNVRLQQAAKLLKEKHMSVAEVADLTGFKSPNNFATSFKNLYGIPPTIYMNQTAEGNQHEE